MARTHRTVFVRARPSTGWTPPYPLPAPGSAIEMVGTSNAEVAPALYNVGTGDGTTEGDFQYACFYAWTSPVFNPYDGPGGRFAICNVGGHQAAEFPHYAGIDMTTGQRFLERSPTGIRARPAPGFFDTLAPTVSRTVTDPEWTKPNSSATYTVWELEGPTGLRMPPPAHIYAQDVYIPKGPRGTLVRPMSKAILDDPRGNTCAFEMDVATGLWAQLTQNRRNTENLMLYSGAGGNEGGAHYDPDRNWIWEASLGWHGGSRMPVIDLGASRWRTSNTGYSYPANAWEHVNPVRSCLTKSRWLLMNHPTLLRLNTTDNNTLQAGWKALTLSGPSSLGGSHSPLYEDDAPDTFFAMHCDVVGTGTPRLWKLAAPADRENGAWVGQDVTDAVDMTALTSYAGALPKRPPDPSNGKGIFRCFSKFPNLGPSIYGWWADSSKRLILLNLAGV